MATTRQYCIGITLALGLAVVGTHQARADNLGEHHNFFVESKYDYSARASVPATLLYVSNHAYFYVDDDYYNSLGSFDQTQTQQQVTSLASEFDSNIYPKETAFWGSEPNPGIDNDPHVTILLERLSSGTGGDFDSTNEYPVSQAPQSNQREMLTANITLLSRGELPVFIAHEMHHLISFNQKEIIHRVDEETWLNELRSQYAVTIAGYNNNFSNSDLRQRAIAFLQDPTDSMPEWPNTEQDYASVTLFGEYLTERYGSTILSDTLHSSLTGIASIDDWLAKHGYSERFNEVFADWAMANYLDGSSSDSRFSYSNPGLRQIQVSQSDVQTISYPNGAAFNYSLKPYQPVWYQYFVDRNTPTGKALSITWNSNAFSVLYYDNLGNSQILSSPSQINNSNGINWFMLIPVNHIKTAGFGEQETPSPISISFAYGNQTSTSLAPSVAPALHDGSLIHYAGSNDMYVITGLYKRYMSPGTLKLYGLDSSQAVTVSDQIFNSYITSNYIRAIDDKKVYAVWPPGEGSGGAGIASDGTKHWLDISATQFSASGRDWNSIFIVNDLERDFYQTGPAITQ